MSSQMGPVARAVSLGFMKPAKVVGLPADEAEAVPAVATGVAVSASAPAAKARTSDRKPFLRFISLLSAMIRRGPPAPGDR
ncbi:hypothetical protein ACFFWE_22500 [Sphaerisporangium melleum]|uniref:Uncharacterized protein n=1 Tax=Sphaerisporangium melleum TaxID=321316 RepID=A0A917R270_9ACTN|nr:hypothetical protein [Sphaerisporangium melleum]GGK82660.1 hypothetical protein GCM10007964_26630 [Sphaerisporangium melleum]